MGNAASGCCRDRGRGQWDRLCPLRPRPLGSCTRIPPSCSSWRQEESGVIHPPRTELWDQGSEQLVPAAGKLGSSTKGSHSKRPRPRLLLLCPPTPPWIQCSQWSECCRPQEQQESLSPLCQDVVGLVLHQHLHAPHIRAPELQAILHPLDLQGKATGTQSLSSWECSRAPSHT